MSRLETLAEHPLAPTETECVYLAEDSKKTSSEKSETLRINPIWSYSYYGSGTQKEKKDEGKKNRKKKKNKNKKKKKKEEEQEEKEVSK